MSICVHGRLCREIYKKTGYIYSCTCPNNCKYFEELLSQKVGSVNKIEQALNYFKRRKEMGLDDVPQQAEDIAIKLLEKQLRYCKTCVYSNNGKIAGTEECHLCMWESQYKPKTNRK